MSDLQLLSITDARLIPTEGKNLVIAADVDDQPHFRNFDAHDNVTAEWREEASASTTSGLSANSISIP